MHENSPIRWSHATWFVAAFLLPVTFQLGCRQAGIAEPKKTPRPVSVVRLQKSAPANSRRVSATVSSWKTEQIGFEVSGRVQWVLEPGEEIEGRVFDSQGQVVTQGTVLAQVDSERYELALEGAKAQVSVAQLQKQGIEVELSSGIPADLEAAKAELELAQVEYDRNKRLVAQQATAQADLDQSQAQLRTARAQIATIQAREKQTQAELKASIASIQQALQTLKDAERNLADTTLYSSFRGQVADVHVVPGSVVAQGSPVLTVQMMNPIKIEVELSADLSRSIRQRHQLPVFVTLPNGSVEQHDGFVYAVSPTADTSTRTFTLTLLVLNKTIETALPPEYKSPTVARTSDLWRMDFDFLPDAEPGTSYIEKKAICQDDQGHYVWKCLNAKVGQPLPDVLEVVKTRITPGDRDVPFLGNWVFEAIRVNDGEEFDASSDLFVGELEFGDGDSNDWDGSQVFLDRGEAWMLRPGDLVEVDMNAANVTAGYYVPLEAIYEQAGDTFIFVAVGSEGGKTAKRIPILVAKQNGVGTGTLRRITSKSPGDLLDGMSVIVSGVHFLRDGESVRLVTQD